MDRTEIVKVVENIRVVIEPRLSSWYRYENAEKHEKRLRTEVDEICAEIKNNRLLDSHYCTVEMEYEYICPHCDWSFGDKKPELSEWDCCEEAIEMNKGDDSE